MTIIPKKMPTPLPVYFPTAVANGLCYLFPGGLFFHPLHIKEQGTQGALSKKI